ncbi:MAG: glycosyltransferase family 4 protein [Smithellaceae bacterium]
MSRIPIRILFLSAAPHVAGGEINLISLLRTMNKDLFQCHLLYEPASGMEEYLSETEVMQVPFRFVPIIRKNLLDIGLMIAKYISYIHRHQITCIYANTISSLKFLLPITSFLKIPVVAHVHIDESDDDLRWVGLDHADRILFPSEYLKEAVLSHSPWLGNEKCFSVLNAVDMSVYFPRDTASLKKSLNCDDGLPIVGIVGQLKEIKGQHLFLEMVKRLRDRGRLSHYLIVGDDNFENGRYLHYLKCKAQELGVADIVNFLGYRKDIPQIMSLLDLLICPSLVEPFGRVVIEAMACGTPVVASSVGGIPEIFDNAEGGLFFRSNNVEELTERVSFFF